MLDVELEPSTGLPIRCRNPSFSNWSDICSLRNWSRGWKKPSWRLYISFLVLLYKLPPTITTHLSEWQMSVSSVCCKILLAIFAAVLMESKPQRCGCTWAVSSPDEKTRCRFPSNSKAGGSSLQAGLLPPLALIYSNMMGATLGLVITWVYNSFTEQLASHLEQPGCNN